MWTTKFWMNNKDKLPMLKSLTMKHGTGKELELYDMDWNVLHASNDE